MSTLRVSNIEAKADPSSPSVDEKLKVTNSNGDVLIHIDGKTAGITTVGINTTDSSFTVDAAQNVEFLGIVTATKFSLSGGGEITGGDGNFTGIVTSGSGNFTGGLSVGTAVTAATANFTSSLTAASANFTGNVSIAGTLTYEDVTNVDSVGIATARTGIDVTSGHIDLVDNSKIRVGTGDDLQVYHDGTDTWIDNDEGDLYIRNTGDDIIIRAADDVLIQTQASEGAIIARGDGQVELYHNNSKKLETTTTGAKVTGALEVTQEYPSIRPILDLNFAATKTLDRRITFTRDSVGTYTDENGLVKYASNNVPRFDHDPDTRESLGLLIEESRTNEIIYSRDLSYWEDAYSGSVEVVQTDTAIAPDGTQTADSMLGDGGSGRYTIRFSQTLATSTQFTFSVFVKKIQGVRYCSLETASYGTWSNTGILTFDLDTGTLLSNTIGGSQGGGIEEYANGWYRIYGVSTTSTNGGNSGFYLNFALSDGGSTLNPGPATNEGLYVWGAQVEAGAFATSYIPTSGSAVTRGADLAKITGTNLTDFYNQPEGTIFADYKVIQSDPEIMYLSNNTSSKRIGLYEAGSAQTRFLIGNSGTLADTTDSAGTTVGDNIKAAGAYKLNDIVAAKNGVISSTDTSATIPDGIDRAYIGGYYNGTAEGVLGLRRLSYYNKRLSNAQLQGLTQQ